MKIEIPDERIRERIIDIIERKRVWWLSDIVEEEVRKWASSEEGRKKIREIIKERGGEIILEAIVGVIKEKIESSKDEEHTW